MRSLLYKVTPERLNAIRRTEKFRDMVACGTMLNALSFAEENAVECELAKFGYERGVTDETLYLTGGLLLKAYYLARGLVEKYGTQSAYVNDFGHFVTSFTDYRPPDVAINLENKGPFRLYTSRKGADIIRKLNLSGKNVLFRRRRGNEGIPVARFADLDEYHATLQRDEIPDTHRDLECVIDCIIDEFMLAAEEFIFCIARELKLECIQTPPKTELKLAA